tara:strand:- start:224 stop:367 length:144 start_codon:yes stop_codon:yes gene_type:complete
LTDSFLSSQTERRSEEVKIFEVFSARSGWPVQAGPRWALRNALNAVT